MRPWPGLASEGAPFSTSIRASAASCETPGSGKLRLGEDTTSYNYNGFGVS